ncbi:hypothetical protein [Streptomyces xinghaiensis]|uniref:hypothetical protein n=1 Tax=Streptomyces xinghaiensis TaxID=1038928 RepID=UPI002E13FE4B|nr:hypothetical protein OG463_13955 [Streptomyces xinghaiensis]
MTPRTSGTTAPRRSAAPQRSAAPRPSAPAQRAAPEPRSVRPGAATTGDGGATGAHHGTGTTGTPERATAAARPSSVAFYAAQHGPARHAGHGFRP